MVRCRLRYAVGRNYPEPVLSVRRQLSGARDHVDERAVVRRLEATRQKLPCAEHSVVDPASLVDRQPHLLTGRVTGEYQSVRTTRAARRSLRP